MKGTLQRSVGVAFIYGAVCYLAFVGFSVLLWRLFPERHSNDQLAQQEHWLVHVAVEKVIGLVLMSLAAFLAARSNRPTWKAGVYTAIATAVIFQLIAMAVYLLRFGVSAYQTYNEFIPIMATAVLLAWLFGSLAVRKQHKDEGRPSRPLNESA